MQRAVGLDFGTTNTAVAVSDGVGGPRLARFETVSGPSATYRSVLHFSPSVVTAGPPHVVAGPDAIRSYLDADTPGRLVQSLKSYLASKSFSATNVYGRIYKLEELLALMIRDVRELAESQFGDLGRRVVVGRPVAFVDSPDDESDALAVERLEAAVRSAGFDEIELVPEPVAAAYEYRRRLREPETSLIADFGGGTTDLSLVELRPDGDGGEAVRILGNGGVAIAGDCFDGRIVHHAAAPALGRTATYRSPFGKELPMPAWLYTHLRRWHHVSFLKSKKTLDMLAEIRRTSSSPEQVDALSQLIEDDLGFRLHDSVQRTKLALSAAPAAEFGFRDGAVILASQVERGELEAWIEPDVDAIAGAVDQLLEKSGVGRGDVDAVFLTGGSAFVPAVRRRFVERFGGECLRGGDELTSVASGLAAYAADRA